MNGYEEPRQAEDKAEAGSLEMQRSGIPCDRQKLRRFSDAQGTSGARKGTRTYDDYDRNLLQPGGERVSQSESEMQAIRGPSISRGPPWARRSQVVARVHRRAASFLRIAVIFFSLSSTRLAAPFSPSATSFRPFSIRLLAHLSLPPSLSLSVRFHLLSGLTGLFLKLGTTRTERYLPLIAFPEDALNSPSDAALAAFLKQPEKGLSTTMSLRWPPKICPTGAGFRA